MKSDSFKDYALDQLAGMPALKCRGMFGGFGLYAGEKFFGIVFQGRLYFKTSADTRASYESRGMKHFSPSAKQQLTSYFEVPADVVEDANELTRWAEEAIRIAGI
jgi:DNA transformation protein and related proteins